MGGLAFYIPSQSTTLTDCNGTWTAYINYVYQGPDDDPYFLDAIRNITSIQKSEYALRYGYRDWWNKIKNQSLEPIYPIPVLSASEKTLGGLPSVLVSRDKV
jgi:hypothetical protein